MPCRYICAYYYGNWPQYLVRGEDDGTLCQKYGKTGVCWNGECLTRYGEDDQWSQQAGTASKVPLRIRKRDITSVTKGATVTKTTESNGDSSVSTKGVSVTKTVKSSGGSEETKSATEAGLKGNYITSFGQQSSAGTKSEMPSAANVDFDPFAIKNTGSGSQTTESLISRGIASPHVSRTVKNGGVKVVVHRGPDGRTVTTRTMRKLIITKGPTTTLRRIIINQGSNGRAGSLVHGGSNRPATKTVKVSFIGGPMRGTNRLIIGGQSGTTRKTSQITTVHTTNGAQSNPIASIVKTIKQQRILGGQNVGGASSATKTVSTVAVTKSVHPPVPVQVTKQVVTPLAAATSETSNTATLRGVEVEAPGYTAGLRHNWKWVLARRVGVYPPYVQALDPDVLFYKLGIRKPNLPSLPGPVLNILNRVPVHPVGSDLYGYLLSSKILEKIRGFTDGVNGLTRLRSLLSTTNTSNNDNSNVLKSIFTGTESSPPGSTFLAKLLLASLSGPGGNLLKSPYGSLFGGSYAGTLGSMWPPFSAGQFPRSSWPFYSRAPLSPLSPFGSYDSLNTATTSTGQRYTLSEDGRLMPSTSTPSPESSESLLSDSSYLKSILAPTTKSSDSAERRFVESDEYLEPVGEKLAQALGEEKLRQLLKISSEHDSPARRILKSLHRRDHDNISTLLRRLGVHENTPRYRNIMRRIMSSRKHGGVFSPYKHTTPYGEEWDKTKDLIYKLRNLRRNSNYDTIRYLSALARLPRQLESLESTRAGPEGSNNKLTTLLQLLLERKHRQPAPRPSDALDSSDTKEVIDAILDYPKRHPSPDRADELKKEITKALLTSQRSPIATEGSRGAHLSKLVSVQGTLHTEKRPLGLAESQVVSTAYHSSKVTPTTVIPYSPATASTVDMTRQITQTPQPGALLGVNGFTTASSSPSPLQPYPQFVSQPFYLQGGNSISDQAALSNRQFVSSTGSMYGSTLGQPPATMMTGTGGYTGYATMPTSTAYLSQYATQPYYVGTSLYGSHPHYIVEGHEAPGTRWQLRVWRHHPSASYVAPGYNGFQSSHLGSVVTRARETVTRGMHLGSQPGQFGFTAYGSTVPGSTIAGATSQYVVRAPDGSIVLSRQPLPLGSSTQGTPASSVVVSQVTKQTTKTTSGSPVSTLSDGLSSNSFQSAVEGASSGGTTKSDALSELTQSKDTSVFKSTGSGSGSENTESLFSTGGSSSSSLQAENDLSQSKLRR